MACQLTHVMMIEFKLCNGENEWTISEAAAGAVAMAAVVVMVVADASLGSCCFGNF